MIDIRGSIRTALLGVAAVALAQAGPAAAGTVTLEFDADNFSDPLAIDNPFFPLVAGNAFIYEAEADECEVNHFTVTTDTKVITIDGEPLTTRVVHDIAYEDDECDGVDPSEVVEDTFDWFAQDDSGNVWYFGEQTFDCEGAGSCTLGSGSWEAGVNGAAPGIVMLADPQSGDRYRQEYAIGTAEDWGMVMNLNRTVLLTNEDAYPPGEWDGCLITREWSALEPGAVEQKTYCEGVGLVAVEEHHGKVLHVELIAPD